jgi:threonine/homoserine/homoserine lactone efflux protein
VPVVELSPFLQGIIIGLTIAVPIGPISLICIHRSITYGRLHGIISGLGVATADSFYAAVAVFGLTAISGIIITRQVLFRVIASLVLIAVGIRVFLSAPSEPGGNGEHESYPKDYFSTLAITIANPLTIIFFITILPGFGLVVPGSSEGAAAPFVMGVFTGSAFWWILLCSSLGSFNSCLSTASLQWINRVSGALIAFLGAGILVLLLVVPGSIL